MKKSGIRILTVIIGVLFLATSTYGAVNLLRLSSRGLSMEWKFEEGAGTTVVDASTHGQNGALSGNTLPSWVSGRFGRALSFDGTSQYVESDTGVPSLGTIDAPYSIATWVKLAPGETDGNIVHISDGSNGYGWCIPFLAVQSGKFSAISFDGNPKYATQSDTPSTDTWHHVVTTWDSTTGLRLYVDGVLKSTTVQTNYAAANAPVYVQIARGSAGCVSDTGFLNGSVDDVRVYSRALTRKQISALYASNADTTATIGKHDHGLTGTFYSGDNFNTYVSTAIDSTINFGDADSSIGLPRVGVADHFTARWTGFVVPAYTEDYTFYTTSDDGARLYVNNQLLVDAWTVQGPTEYSGTLHLLAGHSYPIKLEYWENDGNSLIALAWSSNSVPKDIIPAQALYLQGTTLINDSRNDRVTTGLLGSWSFNGPDVHWTDATNGVAYDRVNINTATFNGMQQSTAPTPGVIGQAINMNGSSSCITASAPVFNNPPRFTIAGWVYPRSYAHAGFFGQNNTIEFGFDGSGNFTGWTPFGGGVAFTQTATAMPLNKWHHVAMIGTGAEEQLYLDGNLVATHGGAVSSYGSDTLDQFSMGCHVWDGNLDATYFNGKLDEVRAYNRALSAQQVKQLYIMGKQ